MEAIICSSLASLASTQGTAAIGNMSSWIRDFLAQNSTSPLPPASLPEPQSDFVDFSQNPATQLLDDLVNKVLGNASSPYNLNVLMDRAIPSGVLPLAVLGLFPISFDAEIS